MGAHPWKGKMMGEVMSHVMLDGGRLRFRSCIPKVCTGEGGSSAVF
jgi:hypothetical protein